MTDKGFVEWLNGRPVPDTLPGVEGLVRDAWEAGAEKWRAENRRCYELQKSQARQILALCEQLAARDAVIARVAQWHDSLDGPPRIAEMRALGAFLDEAPESVLADLIREKQAEAWSERGRDTFPFASKPNPYAEPGKLPTTGIIEYRKGAGQ